MTYFVVRASTIRDANRVFRAFQYHEKDATPVLLLRHRLTTAIGFADDDQWEATVSLLFSSLQPYFNPEVGLEEFAESLNVDDQDAGPSTASNDVVVVTSGDRSVNVQVATTASVKGETHVATLVLDGVVRHLNKHDIGCAMPSIAFGDPMPKKPESIKGAYRGLYVGTSRPTTLLALATHKDRMSEDQLDALKAKGWIVLEAH